MHLIRKNIRKANVSFCLHNDIYKYIIFTLRVYSYKICSYSIFIKLHIKHFIYNIHINLNRNFSLIGTIRMPICNYGLKILICFEYKKRIGMSYCNKTAFINGCEVSKFIK